MGLDGFADDSEMSQTTCDYDGCSDTACRAVSMNHNAITRTCWFCNLHAERITREWGFEHICL